MSYNWIVEDERCYAFLISSVNSTRSGPKKQAAPQIPRFFQFFLSTYRIGSKLRELIRMIRQLLNDQEEFVKIEIWKQIPSILKIYRQWGYSLPQFEKFISKYLFPRIIKHVALRDIQTEIVRDCTHRAFHYLINEKFFSARKLQNEIFIMLRDYYCLPDSVADSIIVHRSFMVRLAAYLNKETVAEVFLPKIVDMRNNRHAIVRKFCCHYLVNLAFFVDTESINRYIIPTLYKLSLDQEKEVRNACIELTIVLSCLSSEKVRRTAITRLMLNALREIDECLTGRQNLGVFISTFAKPKSVAVASCRTSWNIILVSVSGSRYDFLSFDEFVSALRAKVLMSPALFIHRLNGRVIALSFDSDLDDSDDDNDNNNYNNNNNNGDDYDESDEDDNDDDDDNNNDDDNNHDDDNNRDDDDNDNNHDDDNDNNHDDDNNKNNNKDDDDHNNNDDDNNHDDDNNRDDDNNDNKNDDDDDPFDPKDDKPLESGPQNLEIHQSVEREPQNPEVRPSVELGPQNLELDKPEELLIENLPTDEPQSNGKKDKTQSQDPTSTSILPSTSAEKPPTVLNDILQRLENMTESTGPFTLEQPTCSEYLDSDARPDTPVPTCSKYLDSDARPDTPVPTCSKYLDSDARPDSPVPTCSKYLDSDARPDTPVPTCSKYLDSDARPDSPVPTCSKYLDSDARPDTPVPTCSKYLDLDERPDSPPPPPRPRSRHRVTRPYSPSLPALSKYRIARPDSPPPPSRSRYLDKTARPDSPPLPTCSQYVDPITKYFDSNVRPDSPQQPTCSKYLDKTTGPDSPQQPTCSKYLDKTVRPDFPQQPTCSKYPDRTTKRRYTKKAKFSKYREPIVKPDNLVPRNYESEDEPEIIELVDPIIEAVQNLRDNEEIFNSFQFWRESVTEVNPEELMHDIYSSESDEFDRRNFEQSCAIARRSISSTATSDHEVELEIDVNSETIAEYDHQGLPFPLVLMKRFISLSLDDPQYSREGSARIFPAVTYTTGPAHWRWLVRFFRKLASDHNHEIRLRMVNSIHEIVSIVGEELTMLHIVPVYRSLLTDEDVEVQRIALSRYMGVIQSLSRRARSTLLKELRDLFLSKMPRKWQSRLYVCDLLHELVDAHPLTDCVESLLPLLWRMLVDKFDNIRVHGMNLGFHILRRFSTNENFLNDIFRQFDERLFSSEGWRQRQLFVLIVGSLLRATIVPPERVLELFLPHICRLAEDDVPNIRLAVARVLRYILTSGRVGEISASDRVLLEAVLDLLRSDSDRGVKEFANFS